MTVWFQFGKIMFVKCSPNYFVPHLPLTCPKFQTALLSLSLKRKTLVMVPVGDNNTRILSKRGPSFVFIYERCVCAVLGVSDTLKHNCSLFNVAPVERSRVKAAKREIKIFFCRNVAAAAA